MNAMPTTDEVTCVTQDVWRAFVGLEVGQLTPHPSALEAHETMKKATVDISGAWDGSVSVACTSELAQCAAAQLFQVEADGVEQAMVEATLTELANQIGGNLKALLPAPTRLSLPRMASASSQDNAPHSGPAGAERHWVFEQCGQRFDVAVAPRG
jgi:chemotaxis protein CheX